MKSGFSLHRYISCRRLFARMVNVFGQKSHLILDQYLPRYENQQQAITITFIPNCNECDKDRYMEEYGINKQLNTCIRCGKVGHKVSDGLCKSSPKL
jgi:hypothetical protein